MTDIPKERLIFLKKKKIVKDIIKLANEWKEIQNNHSEWGNQVTNDKYGMNSLIHEYVL